MMENFGGARKNGAVGIGMAADGDDQIKGFGTVGKQGGGMAAYIHPYFSHNLYGQGVEAMAFNAGRVGDKISMAQFSGPAFCHLAAAGVTGA